MLVVMAALVITALLCVAALLELAAQGRGMPVTRSVWRLVIGSLALGVVGHLGFVYVMRATRGQLADYYLGEATVIAVVLFWGFVALTLLGALALTVFLGHHRPKQRNALSEYAAGFVVVMVAVAETFIFPFIPAPVLNSPLIIVPFVLVGAFVGTATHLMFPKRSAA